MGAPARKPAGTTVGGQFASQLHAESTLELVDEDYWANDPGWTGPLDDSPIPQADRPAVLAGVVDAIDLGCSTGDDVAEALGMDKRQGGYYTSAAHHLGLIDTAYAGDGKRIWDLTPGGRVFAATEGNERVAAMAEILADSEYVQIYIDGGEEALRAECARSGLAPETTTRRVQTIQSWAEFATGGEKSDRHGVSSAVAAIRARSMELTANRQVEREKRHCPSCHMQLPLADLGECEACGEPLTA